MSLPADYVERVYAGVLGKIIGVYLGRPFEGWPHEKIVAELGEINYYVHEKCGVPLVVTDDDISGTFTFLRAMEDYPQAGKDITARQIGQTWLNYIIEKKAILWWGGMGTSTEHTAFLRLKSGIEAPRSGSIELNSKVVAEQIGAQIFIDGWAMVAPGDPALAVSLARRAASVSHDGEAIYGAQVVAALESAAFVEPDLQKLLDTAVSFIPADSIIARVIADLRNLHRTEPDWRRAYEFVKAAYGYDKFGGGCHMVPNHALIILALLWGADPEPGREFQKSLMIVNTCGWDTDCNAANVGCIQGIRLGLGAIDSGPDWRGPVADRIYIPTADGGRAVSDAASQTFRIVNIARRLAGQPPLAPKNGARYQFSLPGSVQGWRIDNSPECRDIASLDNSHQCLRIAYRNLAAGRFVRVYVNTFIPAESLSSGGYGLLASPTLYSGQRVRAGFRLMPPNCGQSITCRPYIRVYGTNDSLETTYGPPAILSADASANIDWTMPDAGGAAIAELGLELSAAHASAGTLLVDFVTWDGEPNVILGQPAHGKDLWKRAWVDAADATRFGGDAQWPIQVIQNAGRGMLIQGTREWRNYRVEAQVRPHLADACGIAARVQGLERYYALLLEREGRATLVRKLDGQTTLAEARFPWEFGQSRLLRLEVAGDRITATIDGRPLFQVIDATLDSGAVALVCDVGRCAFGPVTVQPA